MAVTLHSPSKDNDEDEYFTLVNTQHTLKQAQRAHMYHCMGGRYEKHTICCTWWLGGGGYKPTCDLNNVKLLTTSQLHQSARTEGSFQVRGETSGPCPSIIGLFFHQRLEEVEKEVSAIRGFPQSNEVIINKVPLFFSLRSHPVNCSC